VEPRRSDEHGRRVDQHPLGGREPFLRLLADSAQDVLYRFRVLPDPGFEYVSPSCTRITGYTPEEHYADPDLPMRLVHPDDRPLLDAMYAADAPDDTVLLRWVRRDGTVVWTEQRSVAVRDEDGRVVAVEGIVRDVSARRRAQQQLEAMAEVTEAILEERPADDVLTLIARRARDLAVASLAVVVVPDQNDRVRVRVADGEGAARLQGASFAAADTLASRVMAGGTPVRTGAAGGGGPAGDAIRRSLNVGPLLMLPLGAARSVAGALSISRPRGAPPFSDDDVEVVAGFARQASMVLERARMRDDLQRLALLRDRERIARDLHDGVIHSLFGVGLVLQVAESQDADDRLIRARVGDAMSAIDRIIVDVRNYVYRLRPSLLQRASLLDALRRLVADLESRHGVIGAVECDDEAADLLHPVAPEVVQMVRAALGNVAIHARSLSCRVSLHREGEVVRVAVEDDGRGFDPAQVSPGQGLDNLGDRARELGGWLLVHSSAGAGTTVEMLLPVAALESRATAAATAGAV
jgi:PAS domain S-box-containing protein